MYSRRDTQGQHVKKPYQLKDAYLFLFQPDPMLQGYGLPLPKLDRFFIGKRIRQFSIQSSKQPNTRKSWLKSQQCWSDVFLPSLQLFYVLFP